MTVAAYRNDPGETVIPLAEAPSLAELADRARAHERITLTGPGADEVLVIAASDEREQLDWEAEFAAESLAVPDGPYLPTDLVAALDTAPPARVQMFLDDLKARAGEHIPDAELWASWERMTSR
jgi:hypothetical protein